MDQVSQFLTNMYTKKSDFVFTVPREFVKACKTPILVAPDDSPPHPYKVAMEVAMLAPNAQVTLYPWKDTPERVPLAVRAHQDVPGSAPAAGPGTSAGVASPHASQEPVCAELLRQAVDVLIGGILAAQLDHEVVRRCFARSREAASWRASMRLPVVAIITETRRDSICPDRLRSRSGSIPLLKGQPLLGSETRDGVADGAGLVAEAVDIDDIDRNPQRSPFRVETLLEFSLPAKASGSDLLSALPNGPRSPPPPASASGHRQHPRSIE